DRDGEARRARHDLRYWRDGPPFSRPGVGRTQGYELLPVPERSAEWVKRLSTEVGWSVAHQPERSRRVFRLLVANRLAHAEGAKRRAREAPGSKRDDRSLTERCKKRKRARPLTTSTTSRSSRVLAWTENPHSACGRCP